MEHAHTYTQSKDSPQDYWARIGNAQNTRIDYYYVFNTEPVIICMFYWPDQRSHTWAYLLIPAEVFPALM